MEGRLILFARDPSTFHGMYDTNQGLEEMKETAREINEAVVLGKETEAGINEVRTVGNPTDKPDTAIKQKERRAGPSLLEGSVNAISYCRCLVISGRLKIPTKTACTRRGGRVKPTQRRSLIDTSIFRRARYHCFPKSRNSPRTCIPLRSGSRGVPTGGRGGFPDVLHAPQTQHRRLHVPVQPRLANTVSRRIQATPKSGQYQPLQTEHKQNRLLWI